ncbi:DUF1553 domain-containing protein [Reichenbachiella sp. MSK19-1]|uniref:DUF1553 domain-containing protein n=1 Tax=Reichenbachiella sp. MSK19-1 TaxID=1897631 RepID=UPI0021014CED|nr:DUF1553 domain-containing protein [Reichenbachiella sp. MSK19-1]
MKRTNTLQNLWCTMCGYILVIIGLSACQPDLPEEVAVAYQSLPQELDFNVHVKPILSDKCFACHGPDKGKIVAGLQLHEATTAYAELPESPGKYAIVPGSLAKSEVAHRILSSDPEVIMPNPESNLKLTANEKAILVKWIEEGAVYKPHWAFEAPKEVALPATGQQWATNAIDRFISARLEQEGLTPSPQADKELLLRRVSLDLTGLPPTPQEIKAFLSDERPDAYEKQVDRLLASPHYGEKMAVDWLDLARYADTHGYQIDRYRDMSPWRDWVIQSFNANMPYDQFLTWQLAGDLLPDASREQIIATGFNRLHPQNAEGGIVDEEFRVEYVADRTAVLSTGVMGLTVACARCHDHKYDPISQKNHYELFAFFNNINETGQISWDADDIPVPNILVPTKEQEEIISYVESLIDQSEEGLAEAKEKELGEANAWIAEGKYTQLSKKELLKGAVAKFDLDHNLMDQISGQSGKMGLMYQQAGPATFAAGKRGKAIDLDGDAWLDLKPVGIYDRSEPFSIGLWVYVPDSVEEGVIFHKNIAVMLHSKKGYHLYLKDNKLEMVMAHTWPDNAIEEVSQMELPKEEWVQLTMTYDGSSQAEGLRLYMNGRELVTQVNIDNLYKDILFHDYEDQIYAEPMEPGLMIGARWRGIGLRKGRADEVTVFDRTLSALEVAALAESDQLGQILSKAPADLLAEEKAILQEYYLYRKSKAYRAKQTELMAQRSRLNEEVEPVKQVMVMKEMETPRQAYVLERGQYSAYGEEVFPNTPESILPFPDSLPRNRLGLAKWLFLPEHPLTARVAVNRYWQNYFGRGIVRTTEDFGNQGEMPSHMELLDWLALDFMHSGWDVKALQKKIVMSSTYRQSSYCDAQLRERDPSNVLLARGPNARLTSEMMRDNALLASTLLNDTIGGPSVKPYQPEGLWQMNANTYVPDSGSDMYRRSLYTFWKRSVPLPTQGTFDQPDRNECTVRRQKTNTPLQALVLLNDPAYVEMSKKIGAEISQADSAEQGIRSAFVSLTGREIKEEELAILLRLREHELEKFSQNPDKMKGWLEAGQYVVQTDLDQPTVVANAVVASAIINSDAAITKR